MHTHGRLADDAELLSGVLYPVLKAAVGFYGHIQYATADGATHLVQTFSPELCKGNDTTYNTIPPWGSNP